jgi:hypothetical protein
VDLNNIFIIAESEFPFTMEGDNLPAVSRANKAESGRITILMPTGRTSTTLSGL